MRTLTDGTLLSGATATSRGGQPRPRCPSLARGLVVAHRPADDPDNRLGVPVVDVLLPRYGLLCRDVPVDVGGAGGNGAAWTPAPATRDRNGAPFTLASWDQVDLDTVDGDRVLLGFVEDDPALPVLLGVLPSKASVPWLPRAADGPVRLLRHQGTVIRIDQWGNVEVDTRSAPVSNAGDALTPPGPAGRVTVRTADGQEVRIDSGTVRVAGVAKVIVEAPVVEIGEGALEALVRGDSFKVFWNAHTHPTPVGVSGTPVVAWDASPLPLLSTVGRVK